MCARHIAFGSMPSSFVRLAALFSLTALLLPAVAQQPLPAHASLY